MSRSTQRGFTLIELLCVMGIILILFSLSLGPVTRALKRAINFGWENDSIQLADQFRDRMSKNFGTVPKYPALTVEQLFEAGLIDYRLRAFLKDKRVQFFPFSSETPDNMAILQVTVSRNRDFFVRKRDLKPEE